MEIEKLSLHIAGYEICAVPTGLFALDGGSMFGTVPKVLWQKTNPADADNRIPMEARSLLLKGNQRNILIDCGNGSDFVAKYGEKLGGKFKEIYSIDDQGPTLLKSLQKHGLQAADITDVILTHLHFDHCGGGTKEVDGQIVATFPNAKYYIQKRNLEIARNPNVRERASYLAANFEPLVQANQLIELDGPVENLLPGISVAVSDGHTVGQQFVHVSDPTQNLVYCGDVIPTSSHVRLAWIMGYDLDPLKIIEEKKVILSAAAQGHWYLYFEHDPYCDAALVVSNGHDFAVKKRVLFG